MSRGQNARLIADGFAAVEMRARVLQMKGHVSVEFWADGKWRFAEGDILTGGDFVRDHRGEPASIDEILRNSGLLDDAGVRPYAENLIVPRCINTEVPEQDRVGTDVDRARASFRDVFGRVVYEQSPLVTPYVIKKTATPDQNQNQYYGWNHYEFCDRTDPTC